MSRSRTTGRAFRTCGGWAGGLSRSGGACRTYCGGIGLCGSGSVRWTTPWTRSGGFLSCWWRPARWRRRSGSMRGRPRSGRTSHASIGRPRCPYSPRWTGPTSSKSPASTRRTGGEPRGFRYNSTCCRAWSGSRYSRTDYGYRNKSRRGGDSGGGCTTYGRRNAGTGQRGSSNYTPHLFATCFFRTGGATRFLFSARGRTCIGGGSARGA